MSYQERLEIFCVECEMGEGRLKNQQLFAADLKQLLADARCRRRKASRVPLETELVLARAEVARLREIVGDSLIDPNKVLKLVAKDRDDLLQEVARLREELEWQSAENAPIEATRVIAAYAGVYKPVSGTIHGKRFFPDSQAGSEPFTHWMRMSRAALAGEGAK